MPNKSYPINLRRRPLPERLGYLEKRLVRLAEENLDIPHKAFVEILAVAFALGVERAAWERILDKGK